MREQETLENQAPSAPEPPSAPEGGFGLPVRCTRRHPRRAQHGARRPDLPDDLVRLRRRGRRRDLFALQVRQHLLPHQQPHRHRLRERIASLEGGIRRSRPPRGWAPSSSPSRRSSARGYVVSSAQLYGTVTQLDVTLRRFGVETTFVASSDPEDYRAAFRPETKVLAIEMIGNPPARSPISRGWPRLAHDGVPLVVDATLATPYLVRRARARPRTSSSTRPRSSSAGTAPPSAAWSSRVEAPSTGAAEVPLDDRAGRVLRRAALVGQLRRVRLPHKLRSEQLRISAPPSPRRRRSSCCRAWRRSRSGSTRTWLERAVAEWLGGSAGLVRDLGGLESHPHHERAASTCRSAPAPSSPSVSGRRGSTRAPRMKRQPPAPPASG